jgi:hypothetical protein
MIAALRSEFRKLFSTRSTYIIVGLSLLLACSYSFYVSGYRASTFDVHSAAFLAQQVTGAVGVVTVFGALVGILLISHEYRYSTLIYTLTASTSRTKTLIAKVLAISAYAIAFTIVVGVLSPLMAYLGASMHHLTVVHQEFTYSTLIWRSLFYGWAYMMIGLILGFVFRNTIAAIAVFFLFPGTVEPLLTLILKSNAVYLPFSSLNLVIVTGTSHITAAGSVSPLKAASVVMLYLIGGWAIAWFLFEWHDVS